MGEQQLSEQADIGEPILPILRRLYDKISVMQMELEKFFQEEIRPVIVHGVA